MKAEPTFLVDKAGLAKLVEDKPKAFILYELVQNAWDEDTTEVEIEVTRPSAGITQIRVSDNNPEGFANIAHAYTLFAESAKKNDPTKRGRFNLGEKLVIALAEYAYICTTKGTVSFDEHGRTFSADAKRVHGSEFLGRFKMNVRAHEQMMKDADMLIPPKGIETRINGASVGGFHKTPIAQCNAALATVRSDEDGNLRPTRRQTSVTFHDVPEGEKPTLYEMGIPVVEIDCGYHVNVQQKVPLNADRDNVTPAYLREIQTVTLNHLAQADMVKGDDATKGWVNDALASPDVKVEAVQAIIKERYGDKVVIYDPSDREGTDIATSKGYTVLPPRTFTHAAWENVKASGVLPAGQVTPSPKVYEAGGRPENVIPVEEWTPAMGDTAGFYVAMARRCIDRNISVKIVREPHVDWSANYGGARLTLNYSKLGKAFFENVGGAAMLELGGHELAHDRISNHLSERFGDEVARILTIAILWLAGHGAGEKTRIRTEDW